jgi:hypothetical protein
MIIDVSTISVLYGVWTRLRASHLPRKQEEHEHYRKSTEDI